MDMKLELVIVPVSDVDRAKQFYADAVGFTVDVDVQVSESMRIVQLTPPGSACSITIMASESGAGSLDGLHLIVTDIAAARAELAGRGVPISEPYHFEGGVQVAGVDPTRARYGSFAGFSDPDGNGWLMQEVPDDDAAAAPR